jgi:hypothetical protein
MGAFLPIAAAASILGQGDAPSPAAVEYRRNRAGEIALPRHLSLPEDAYAPLYYEASRRISRRPSWRRLLVLFVAGAVLGALAAIGVEWSHGGAQLLTP